MPFYEVQHSFPLTPTQKSALAANITNLHATTFSAPSLFVNVKFSPLPASEDYYIGGQLRPNTNRIFAHVRSGQGRGDEAFAKLAASIETIWNEVVEGGEGDFGVGNVKMLHGVFVVPGLTAREQGFAIPVAGGEGPWLESNWAAFKARADAGDEDMRGLVEEVGRRPDLRNGAVSWEKT